MQQTSSSSTQRVSDAQHSDPAKRGLSRIALAALLAAPALTMSSPSLYPLSCAETKHDDIVAAFKSFTLREDISVILITQTVREGGDTTRRHMHAERQRGLCASPAELPSDQRKHSGSQHIIEHSRTAASQAPPPPPSAVFVDNAFAYCSGSSLAFSLCRLLLCIADSARPPLPLLRGAASLRSSAPPHRLLFPCVRHLPAVPSPAGSSDCRRHSLHSQRLRQGDSHGSGDPLEG